MKYWFVDRVANATQAFWMLFCAPPHRHADWRIVGYLEVGEDGLPVIVIQTNRLDFPGQTNEWTSPEGVQPRRRTRWTIISTDPSDAPERDQELAASADRNHGGDWWKRHRWPLMAEVATLDWTPDELGPDMAYHRWWRAEETMTRILNDLRAKTPEAKRRQLAPTA
jgi:hypothetical protein